MFKVGQLAINAIVSLELSVYHVCSVSKFQNFDIFIQKSKNSKNKKQRKRINMFIFSFIIHKFTPSPPKVMKMDRCLRKQNRPPIFKTSALSQYNAFTIENKRMLVYNKTHQRPVVHIAHLNNSFYMKTDFSNIQISTDPGTPKTQLKLYQLLNHYFLLKKDMTLLQMKLNLLQSNIFFILRLQLNLAQGF